MAAPVRIEARAWNDLRFVTLSRALGLADADHALIKVARLWSWQTEHYSAESPTYVIDRDTIESVLGVGGPEALVRAKLADVSGGGWRMRGTEGGIEWCAGLSSKRQRAGQARAASAKRAPDGRMIGNEDYHTPAHAGCAGPAPASTEPAQSSAPDPSPDPSPDQEPDPESEIPVKPKRARRLEPGWVPERGDANVQAEQVAKARGVDLRGELAKLHDWALSNGAKRADWNAVWRNWTRNARAESRRPAQQPLLQTLLTDIAELQRQEDLEKAGAS